MSGKTKAQSTEDYLKNVLGMEAEVTDAEILELSYESEAQRWVGETHDRLSGEFDFYRATTFASGVSIRKALSDGWRALPESADIKLEGVHDGIHDAYMIRHKDVGKRLEAQREENRRARDQKGRTDAHNIHAGTGRVMRNKGEQSFLPPVQR